MPPDYPTYTKIAREQRGFDKISMEGLVTSPFESGNESWDWIPSTTPPPGPQSTSMEPKLPIRRRILHHSSRKNVRLCRKLDG